MFDAAPPPSDHALLQDSAFAAALKLCGQSPIKLPCGLTLLCRRILGIPFVMLPRAEPPRDLDAQLASVGLARVPTILSPERPCKDMRAVRIRLGIATATIDLTPKTDTRRASLHAKWRNQLCRAEDSPLQIRSTSLKTNHPILRLEEQQARARRYANWPTNLTAAFATVAPDQTRLFTAYLFGTPVSHMLFLLHGGRATYHIGHTNEEGRKYHAHNLLLWNASCWLAKSGRTSLDLGLLHTDTHSLNRFKLRSGAHSYDTGGTWLRWHPFARKTAP
ncbi:MAG: GNAT family N-acetyltransferase [Aliishimia sp.]